MSGRESRVCGAEASMARHELHALGYDEFRLAEALGGARPPLLPFLRFAGRQKRDLEQPRSRFGALTGAVTRVRPWPLALCAGRGLRGSVLAR